MCSIIYTLKITTCYKKVAHKALKVKVDAHQVRTKEEAKAWALREVWMDHGKRPYGMYTFIARRVRKTWGGKARGDHPTNAGIKEFSKKIDCDPDWFPGKHNGQKRGPIQVLTGAKRTAIVFVWSSPS